MVYQSGKFHLIQSFIGLIAVAAVCPASGLSLKMQHGDNSIAKNSSFDMETEGKEELNKADIFQLALGVWNESRDPEVNESSTEKAYREALHFLLKNAVIPNADVELEGLHISKEGDLIDHQRYSVKKAVLDLAEVEAAKAVQMIERIGAIIHALSSKNTLLRRTTFSYLSELSTFLGQGSGIFVAPEALECFRIFKVIGKYDEFNSFSLASTRAFQDFYDNENHYIPQNVSADHVAITVVLRAIRDAKPIVK